jgi:hypothetical protein
LTRAAEATSFSDAQARLIGLQTETRAIFNRVMQWQP